MALLHESQLVHVNAADFWRDQLLLCPVMDVAFDPPALGVGSIDQLEPGATALDLETLSASREHERGADRHRHERELCRPLEQHGRLADHTRSGHDREPRSDHGDGGHRQRGEARDDEARE